jgi:glycosyltransferase involved in cell wall biosynthesis
MTKASKANPVLLQILPSLYSGGVERGTVEIAHAASREGFHSIVVSSGGPMVQSLEAVGVKHIRMAVDSKNPLIIILNALRLMFVIRKHKVAIVHARSRAPAWSAYLATRVCKARFVTTFHGLYGLKAPMKCWYNSVMTKGDSVIAISDFIAAHIQQYYQVSAEKIVTIHRGVDLDYFNPERVEKEQLREVEKQWKPQKYLPVVAMPGRFTRWKGHKFLLEALRLIPHHDYTCIMVGDIKKHPEYVREIQEIIETYRMRGHVHLCPHTPLMAAGYMLADVVVCPSIEPEAFGRVVTEAQAMGKMVIATGHGGAAETIVHGETGWLVSPNDPKELADTLQHVFGMSEADKAVVAKAAKAHIRKNFSLQHMTGATIGLYQKLMEESSAA